jgi:hypothetical protein
LAKPRRPTHNAIASRARKAARASSKVMVRLGLLAVQLDAEMMRRNDEIVNEMEFRMSSPGK